MMKGNWDYGKIQKKLTYTEQKEFFSGGIYSWRDDTS
jgi:hypothetical protein